MERNNAWLKQNNCITIKPKAWNFLPCSRSKQSPFPLILFCSPSFLPFFLLLLRDFDVCRRGQIGTELEAFLSFLRLRSPLHYSGPDSFLRQSVRPPLISFASPSLPRLVRLKLVRSASVWCRRMDWRKTSSGKRVQAKNRVVKTIRHLAKLKTIRRILKTKTSVFFPGWVQRGNVLIQSVRKSWPVDKVFFVLRSKLQKLGINAIMSMYIWVIA